ncbi:MAG: M48 family metalloprotease [Armatimonadetes bacterium]|nr:M48 family metalloprotease [Armatimonadota bacterium]
MRRGFRWLTIVLLALAVPLQAVAKTTDEERKIGKEAAEQIAKDKSIKFVTDPAVLERVDRISKAVAAAAQPYEPDLTYTFKVIDTKDVNAFSLPGGYIYLNKGLIDRCESDDELAGVIGHEIAHAAQHHLRKLMSQAQKFNWATLAIILAGAVSGTDVGGAALLSQVITQARVSGYGMKFETESDRYAIEYLMKTPYNPVGVLTFMEKLARDESRKGGQNVDMGIYQTHPLSKDRVDALIKLLNEKQIPIDRRKVTTSMKVVAKEGKLEGQPVGEIWLGKTRIAALSGDDERSALERAQEIAKKLDLLLDRKWGVMDVRLGPEERSVWIGKSVVLNVTPDDARVSGKTPEEIAKLAQTNLQNVIWK